MASKLDSASLEMGGRMNGNGISAKSAHGGEWQKSAGAPDFKLTLLSLVDAVCHGVAISLAIYLFYDCLREYQLLSWHAPLFTLAYMLFMTEGFLIFLPHSALTRGWSRKHLVKLHWILQLIGFICIVLGMIIIVVYKLLNNKRHFAKPHSITGLVAVIFAVVVSLFGWWTRINRKYHYGFKLSTLKLFHAGLGVVAYGVGVAAQVLGYYSNYYIKKHDVDWRVFLSVITALLGTTTFLFAVASLYKRLRTYLHK
ncbi:transmembrane reductase CYB561D2-like [Neocloeon triangulifer]|uniref:transmembrane reductase CYB561D2-like n=1 Tax=Neocloeon triangulifer TaxID=2078957 RepID=UPI00286EE00A|nr:transmembrane reductase CYB561D2-like [Neocloeon triangulifer]XP_059485140.1 transmembrane reductase CYB561D2-like [Neocloeon triangulifer]